jgi:hypothetical protein
MSHIPFHPAVGFGDLLPGSFAVPANPIRDAGTALVPTNFAVTGNRPYRVPGIGELLSAKFTVPQNPLRNTLVNGWSGTAPKLSGCGCSGGGCGCGGHGMGDLSDFTAWLQTASVGGVPNWLIYGGAAVAAWMIFMPGGSEYRTKSRALRSQYRGYRRASRSAGSTLSDV